MSKEARVTHDTQLLVFLVGRPSDNLIFFHSLLFDVYPSEWEDPRSEWEKMRLSEGLLAKKRAASEYHM